MSRTSKNFVVAYIFLVGLPLLGLVGILRSGRHLAAATSIDGAWRIDADARSLAKYSCASVSTLLQSPLLISQSGRTLEISFKGKDPVPALFEDKSLKTALPLGTDSATSGCGNGVVTLAAVVDPKSDPRSMTGQVSVLGCPSCATLSFTAVRLPKIPSGAGH